MFPILTACLLVLVIVLLIVIARRPATFMVSRSLLIAAPAAQIFAHVEDFHAWTAWSPWEGIDPHATRTYSGAATGVGAIYRWSGNNQVGQGEMTITDARPGEHLGLDITFLKPFAARNRVTFDFASSSGGTTVTWSMSGRNSFMFKAMGLFIDCDKLIGDQYVKGLAQLKVLCKNGMPHRT